MDPLGNPKKAKAAEIHLTAIVLDTLLCILVDSSPALRMFEEASGVQYVVRILKRAGTPREVRYVGGFLFGVSLSSRFMQNEMPRVPILLPHGRNNAVNTCGYSRIQ